MFSLPLRDARLFIALSFGMAGFAAKVHMFGIFCLPLPWIMKVTILQRDIAWGQPAVNRALLEDDLLKEAKADLFVLPEMFSTGFATEPQGIAEQGPEPESLLWMQRMANLLDAALCGSVAVETAPGTFVNRLYFVQPDGETTFYDKHHLFTYGGEHKRFTAGNERVVVTWKGVRILLMVCYDLRFPLWSRNHEDYDMAVYVASWPASRANAWHTLLLARAIENQCYVVGVNRIGQDPNCLYSGGSMIVDPYGLPLTACPDNTACTASATIDMERLLAFRQKFPVLKDADPACK